MLTYSMEKTAAARFASDIFSDSFDLCMDKTMEEVQNILKHYSNLTQNQGQIRVTPAPKKCVILPISRRYRADRFYDTKRLDGKFSTDTLWGDMKSLNQHAQVCTHKCGFSVVYPMDNMTGDSIGHTLQDFIHDYGIPSHLTFDGYQSQLGKGSLFMKTIRKYGIKFHVSSPRRPEQNPAEGGIRELKRRWYRIMSTKNVPHRLWDYGLVWVSKTGNLTVSGSRYAHGRTGLEIITGETPDISEYIKFEFYDWVTYRDNAGLGKLSLGKWIGVSHKIGQLMSYWILTIKGRVISCTTAQQLTELEQRTPEWQSRMELYEKEIKDKVTMIKDAELNISDVPEWNCLTMDEFDPEFINTF